MCTLQKQHMGFLERTKKKLLRNFYDHGIWVLLKKCILHLIKPLYTKELIVLYKIDIKNATANKNHTNNYTFRFISSVDTAAIKQIIAMEEWIDDELQDKLSGGSICMGAFDKDKLIGFYLASFSQTVIPLLTLQLYFKNDVAWGDQITVHRNYRKQNVATELKSRIYFELKNKGIRNVYGNTRASNKAALRSIAYFSPEKAMLFRYFRFLSYETLKYGSLSTQHLDSIDKLNSLRQSQCIHATHDIVKKTNTLFEYNLSF